MKIRVRGVSAIGRRLITNWNRLGTDNVDQFTRVEGDDDFAVAALSRSEFLHVANHLAQFDVTATEKMSKL